MFNSHNLEKLLSRVPVKVPVNVGYVDWRNETVFCRLSDDESDYKSLLSRMNHFYSNGALRKRVLQVKTCLFFLTGFSNFKIKILQGTTLRNEILFQVQNDTMFYVPILK